MISFAANQDAVSETELRSKKMGFKVDLTQIPGLEAIISKAIEDGENWGNQFIEDSSWKGNQERMSNHAIYESTLWSIGKGMATGVCGFASIPVDLADSLYSQVKLSSTLWWRS
jgi:hypothetical protein